jgi:hypothetical protein
MITTVEVVPSDCSVCLARKASLDSDLVLVGLRLALQANKALEAGYAMGVCKGHLDAFAVLMAEIGGTRVPMLAAWRKPQ